MSPRPSRQREGPLRQRSAATGHPRAKPLEPQTEKKYYVAGVGELKEQVVKGHHEAFELVDVTR
jgi:hypothetical protein